MTGEPRGAGRVNGGPRYLTVTLPAPGGSR